MAKQYLIELISLCETRLDILNKHVRLVLDGGSGSLFDRKFLTGDYLNNVKETITCYQNIIIENYLDFHRQKVITEDNLKIFLDVDTILDKCEISELIQDNVAIIDISLTMFLLLDICSTFEFTPDSLQGKLDGKLFDTLSSDYFTKIVNTNLNEGLTDVAKSLMLKLFYSANPSQRRTWATITSLSTLWLFYHEIGHYICCHCSYTATYHGALGISESKRPTNGFKNPLSSIDLSGNMMNWAVEFQADWYATFRLIYHMQLDLNEKQFFINSSEELNRFLVIACSLPLTYSLISSDVEKGDESDNFLDDVYPSIYEEYVNGNIGLTQLARTRALFAVGERYYPPETSRLFNLFACLHFACFPLRNVNFDIRRSPIKDFGAKYMRYETQQRFLIDTLGHFVDIFKYLEKISLKKVDIISPESYAKFIGSIAGSREAIVAFDKEDFKKPTALLDIMLGWQYIVTQLCSEWNMYFVMLLKTNWTTKKGDTSRTLEENISIIDEEELHKLNDSDLKNLFDIGGAAADPIYKVIDDWMSIICMVWHESPNFDEDGSYEMTNVKSDHYNFDRNKKKGEYYHMLGLSAILSLNGISIKNIKYPDNE